MTGRPAEVVSTCPATGNEIRLHLAPERIESAEPETVSLSIVEPGISAACSPGLDGGARGPTCSSMHFFSSQEAAATWLVDAPDIAVLPLVDA